MKRIGYARIAVIAAALAVSATVSGYAAPEVGLDRPVAFVMQEGESQSAQITAGASGPVRFDGTAAVAVAGTVAADSYIEIVAGETTLAVGYAEADGSFSLPLQQAVRQGERLKIRHNKQKLKGNNGNHYGQLDAAPGGNKKK